MCTTEETRNILGYKCHNWDDSWEVASFISQPPPGRCCYYLLPLSPPSSTLHQLRERKKAPRTPQHFIYTTTASTVNFRSTSESGVEASLLPHPGILTRTTSQRSLWISLERRSKETGEEIQPRWEHFKVSSLLQLLLLLPETHPVDLMCIGTAQTHIPSQCIMNTTLWRLTQIHWVIWVMSSGNTPSIIYYNMFKRLAKSYTHTYIHKASVER